jgi:hypothetical protein
MDSQLRKLLSDNFNDAAKQYELAGISTCTVKDYVLAEMAVASNENQWKTWITLLSIVRNIDDPHIKADTLNHLLVMPEHQIHQEVTMEIQALKHPSSVPYIRSMLESEFRILDYSCSEPEAIAKWFSHALASINTPEAIAVIQEYVQSRCAAVASEMAYRLSQIDT